MGTKKKLKKIQSFKLKRLQGVPKYCDLGSTVSDRNFV